MTKRQAKVASDLINGSYLAMADHPNYIPGAKKEDDAEKIVAATNDLGWKILHRYGFERALSLESAYQYAIENY